ncbi:MAG: SpoIID/LytB domain-containing protein, partial [Acidobacteriota bacterium]
MKEGIPAVSYADWLGIKKPIVRIGLLGSNGKITVSCEEPFKILETSTGQNVWKETYSGEVILLPYGVSDIGSNIYRVQIGSFANREEAEALKLKVEQETRLPAIVSYFPDRRIYRVRVGEAKSSDATQPIAAELKELGYSEVWISEELPEWRENLFIRIVDQDFLSQISRTDSLVILPSNPSATLRVNEKEYRGYFEVKIYPTGVLRTINILNIEDYLKGVVPLELGPELWPEIESLKAQAVAARTYIYKNLGQFADEGYDICDTQRCQVYGGKDAEHPLSSRAVDETYGQIAVHAGLPINALYTSTCGGMTEDAINIFELENGEYLKGVECYPDRQSLASKTFTVFSSEEIPLVEIGGDPELLKAFALLMVHGIFDQNFLKEEWEPKRRMRSDDTIRLLLKSADLSGIIYEGPLTVDVETVLDFWQLAAKVFSINKRADLQISEKDMALLLQMGELEGFKKEYGKLMAYLIREGIIPAALSLSMGPSERLTQDYFIFSLSNLMKRFGGFKLKEGSFRELSENAIGMVSESSPARFPLSSRIVLFNYFGGDIFPAEEIKLIPGDKFSFHLDDSAAIDYLERKPPMKGASDDR